MKNRRQFLALMAIPASLASLASAQPPAGVAAPAQSKEADAPPEPPSSERWNLFWQATSVGQYHGTFHSPYSGPFSLQNYTERDVSLTTTFFLGLRLSKNTELYFDPEIAGGRGFSGVNGLANSSNGELPRVASATPKPYVARLYVSHDFALSSETEAAESDENQLGGSRPLKRYTLTAGRFTLTDFFDNNRYSHDPRTQFLGWGVMFNGAWDYPADVRGYTWGWVHELHLRNWSLRYASAAMPREANGLRFDRRLFRNRGDVFEGEYRYQASHHPGAVRVLYYRNSARAGTYADSLQIAAANRTTPDVTVTRRDGTTKYGFGLNVEHEILKDLGVFGRLGWNNGKTESFAFTAIDRLATLGVSVTGTRWHRPFDTVATEFTASGLSRVHRSYLAAGGSDFLIGDGRLNYGLESISETYYSARLLPGFFASFDLQHVANPAYNKDRGPVWIPSIRFHLDIGHH